VKRIVLHLLVGVGDPGSALGIERVKSLRQAMQNAGFT
jgi:hypothetical protein